MEKEFEERFEKVSILNKTHFPKSKIEHNLIHMKREIEEVLENPEDLEEWADILICYMGGFGKTKFTTKELFESVDKKIEKNINIKWKENGDGNYSNIKE